MKADGTIAKEIAIYFLDKTADRFTPSVVAKTIIQTKTILESGYSKDEILSVIDYIIDVKKVDMYSIGYVSHAINDILKEMNKEEEIKKLREERKKQSEAFKSQEKEVEVDLESKQRNQSKLDRFGTESRKREEPYSDLFK